jgi:hypothetical protein
MDFSMSLSAAYSFTNIADTAERMVFVIMWNIVAVDRVDSNIDEKPFL